MFLNKKRDSESGWALEFCLSFDSILLVRSRQLNMCEDPFIKMLAKGEAKLSKITIPVD
jgi:hypothetical protein